MCEYMDLEATQENKDILKNLKNGECLFQDLDRHIGILRFDAVFQDIIDLFSTTPKTKSQERNPESQESQTSNVQEETNTNDGESETEIDTEWNFDFAMEDLLKKESVNS